MRTLEQIKSDFLKAKEEVRLANIKVSKIREELEDFIIEAHELQGEMMEC